MILVRAIFQAKWGKANEVVAQLKGMMRAPGAPQSGVRLLTDLSGEFHTVVFETQFESLAEWEQARTRMFASPEMQASAAAVQDLVVSGRQDYYTIEAES
jgi:hypothetical protein